MNLEEFKQLHLNHLKELEQEQKTQLADIFENVAASKKEKKQLKKEKIYSKKSKVRKEYQRKSSNFKTKEYKFKKNYLE